MSGQYIRCSPLHPFQSIFNSQSNIWCYTGRGSDSATRIRPAAVFVYVNRQLKKIRWVLTCLTYLSLARFQASTTVQTRSLQVWVVTHHILVVVYRCFEMAYQGPSYNPSTASPLDQLIGCSKTLFSGYWHTLCNNPEQWRTHLSQSYTGRRLAVLTASLLLE